VIINEFIELGEDVTQGEGDLTKRIEVKSDDEIGELSKCFNTFIKKLPPLPPPKPYLVRQLSSPIV